MHRSEDLTTLNSAYEGAFRPGTVLGGRYRIVSLLGAGAMGEVYRADDLKVGQRVALKFLPPRFAVDAGRVQRFVTELRLARQISHPNVCRVYDINESDGRQYLSMEYIDGETLASLLDRIGRLPYEKVVDIARQMCAGLVAAHAQGVLHRDLKPSNVMLDGRGRVRITDFGLAVTDDTRTAGEIAGTPGYMAPEQIAGGVVSRRTDLFALGLIVAELLSGKRLLRARTVHEQLRQEEDVETLARAALSPNSDARLVNMIARCLQADPARRPASASEVASALPGGGDPLEAALAAGEMPSPEMVAAAGDNVALHPRTAVVCLAFALTGVLISAWQMDAMMLYRQVPLLKSPEILAERAQKVITKAGYADAPRDSAYWFVAAGGYGDFVRHRSALYEPFWYTTLRAPAALVFVYRQSPEYLVPENILGVVEYREPPADLPGMADITLDADGHVLRFSAVPDGRRQPGAGSPDWAAMFAEAGFDHTLFQPAETIWTPPVMSDAVHAWEWRAAASREPVRVLAASFNGKPVAFETTEFAAATEVDDSPLWGEVAYFALTMAVLVGAAMLARWNIRQGQWDRVGARRLFAYMVVAGLMTGVLRADHVPRIQQEYLMLARITGWTLYIAGFTFLMYAAFEPLVRRRWPRVLISWTRLLAGRPRDPIVGRDLLIGSTAGVLTALLRLAEYVICQTLGIPPPPPFSSTLDGLGSWQQFASLFLFVQSEALTTAMALLVLLLLLRIVARRDNIAAVAATILVLPLATLPGSSSVLSVTIGALIAALGVLVLFRFGLLAVIVGIFVANTLTRLPVTLDPSEWYAGRSAIVLLCISALIVYGFHTSLGGRPLFSRRLVEE